MTRSQGLDVSKIVEDYRNKFGQAERRVLKDAILKKYGSLNVRTLDRHLKKAFEKKADDSVETPQVRTNKGTGIILSGWDPAPDFAFSPKFEEANRENRKEHEVDDDPAVFPRVPFNWKNHSSYQLFVRLVVRVFLGGRFLSIINDPKNYYNGKEKILVEPGGRLRDGCFTLPSECNKSKEETTIEVQAKIYDQNDMNKKEYLIIKSWSYDPEKNNWYYEPRRFSEDPLDIAEGNSWDFLTQAFLNIGANLMEIEIEKFQSENKMTIQGIVMLKGAKTMQEAIKTYISDDYEAFLFSKVKVEKEDKLTWQGITYKIKEIEDIYDVYSFSYRIAKMVKYVKPRDPVVLF